MSHRTFNTAWEDSDRQLRDLTALEADVDLKPAPTDRAASIEYYALLYIRYIQIFKNLSDAYDQMVHPQKRRVLRTLVDGTMGRVLELKHTLVDLDCSDYHYFDEIIADLKLTPEDIEIHVPLYFRREVSQQLRERERVLDAAEADTMDPRQEPPAVEVAPMARDVAIRMIQVHERARQGRLRAKFMMDVKAENARQARLGARGRVANVPMTMDEAAQVLQRHIRGYLARQRVRRLQREGDVFIGMTMPPPLPKSKDPLVKAAQTVTNRHATQEQYETQYIQDLVNIRSKVEQVEGPDMKENMADEIREVFTACVDATGSFPDFPDVEAGGSKAFFDPPPPPPPVEDDEGGDAKGKGKGSKKEKKGSKKKKGGKKSKKGKGDDGDGEGAPEGPPPSVFAPLLQSGSEAYHREWKANEEDRKNVHQKHDRDEVKAIKRREVEEMLRLQVDELMREELANLKAAVDGDKKKKKGKKGKGKGKKGKKGKGAKGKGKKGKDMTADRTPMSLLEELAREGIAKRVPEIKIGELVGQYSHLATAQQRDPTKAPEPSMADVRRVATVYGVLPLGSPAVHETQPVHVKSLLLVGPPGSGKKTLVAAMAYELGASLFDLTPANTAGKYTAKKGVDGLDGLMHKVFKLAKLFQPSIVYIGNACSVHVKKKAKDDPYDSTRMKKELPKIVKKELSPGDRVIIIGTDDKPYDADMKALSSVYQKIIRVPRPDYGTRIMLWQHFIEAQGGILTPELDLSSLSKISDGYTAGTIQACVRKVLISRRVAMLHVKKLTASEFVPALAHASPVYDEEDKELVAWMAKTPLGKKAEKLGEGGGGGDGGGGGKKKKKSGKKKKKK